MKQLILITALVLSFGACQKADKQDDAAPVSIASNFGQDFTLHYRQQATLPAAGRPEVRVELSDLQYSICPKNARCFGPNFVYPVLIITDAQGRLQQLKMPVNHANGLQNGDFIDTTSIRANGQRYLVQYTNWKAKDTDRDYAEKQDLSVELRVTKPTGN